MPEITDYESTKRLEKPLAGNLFSVAPGCDFLGTLVDKLVSGELLSKTIRPSDLDTTTAAVALADTTIFVPNRRAAREITNRFIDAAGGAALLLPDIRTLGDVGDEQFGLSPDTTNQLLTEYAAGEMERKLQLAQLVFTWANSLNSDERALLNGEDIFLPASQADALRLTNDLARLFSELTREEISWATVQNIIPDEHAQWWQLTSRFLNIIMEHWPLILSESGKIDPSIVERKLFEERIEFYRSGKNKGPVIVAGSTGSIPMTARLLKAVAGLSDGAIVLPGIDFSISPDQWKMLLVASDNGDTAGESHPQFGLARLLRLLGTDRDTVQEIGNQSTTANARSRLIGISQSLPSFATGWRKEVSELGVAQLNQALQNINLINAGNERQEALAIALIMREALEVPDKTIALVTPDRNLARRVSVELERFGIVIDDTAGRPLKNTAVGKFIRQLMHYCFAETSRTKLTSILKSEYCVCGLKSNLSLPIGEWIERHVLRGSIHSPEPGKLASFLENHQGCNTEDPELSTDKDYNLAHAHALTFDKAVIHLLEGTGTGSHLPLSVMVRSLLKCIAQITTDDEGLLAISAQEGYEEILTLLESLLEAENVLYTLSPTEFPAVFDALIEPVTVRSRAVQHPRLQIYGPLEVRLLQHDRVILAGLNEGTWPQSTRNDAFLNRVMRAELGLPLPERSTGLAAHDFQQLATKEEVFFTRSQRVDKAPTIPSRWIQRLNAIIGEKNTEDITRRGDRYLAWANLLDKQQANQRRTQRPYPTPPIEIRPTALPVTDIETWIRDPYALYAKRILKLRPLDPLEREPDPLLKGTVYHAIMEEYVATGNTSLPANDRLQNLSDIAEEIISSEQLPADIERVWLNRFRETAIRFIDWESGYLKDNPVTSIHKEVAGTTDLFEGAFRLYARADRIDELSNGELNILDYKTGLSPSIQQALTLSPQLALEGVIAAQGGFSQQSDNLIKDLFFLRLRNDKNFGQASLQNKKDNIDITTAMSNALVSLGQLFTHFQQAETGYLSRRAPFKEGDISGDYDHLARTREWSFGEADDSEA